jgi:hypothetical protein
MGIGGQAKPSSMVGGLLAQVQEQLCECCMLQQTERTVCCDMQPSRGPVL